MFATVKAEAAARLLGVQTYFRSTCGPGYPLTALIAKGIVFVQMHSVYEYSVTGAVRSAILEIKTRNMAINTVRWELLGLVLDAELASVRDCGTQKLWLKRIALMQRVNAADVVDIPDSTFPDNGTQFRLGQLEMIWQIFGIPGSVLPHPRFSPFINEMVEHRNAIAHGRSPAEDVGRRFTKDDILAKISQCEQLCMHVISGLENHCAAHANLIR